MSKHAANKRRASLIATTLTVLFTLTANTQAHASEQPHNLSWLTQAEQWLDQQAQQRYDNAEVNSAILPLDPRLRLKPCSDPAFHLPQANLRGRVSLKVVCRDAAATWSIFLPAQISLTAQAATTRQAMSRGAVLSASDVVVQQRDVTHERNGWLAPQQATGLALKRPLPAGSLLSNSVLEPAVLVKRGDDVVLRSNRGGITIEAEGVALAAGAAGEPIRIRNERSNRVVRGWVAAAGVVATEPP
ncbi:MAG: flagellar basal body P-ring formation chaperone FlgA [Pseudomonadaceae bacterium]|nr:flagellar basal body P-ring formation chaperone FlgA [Pseudomonadaceae bacterium]